MEVCISSSNQITLHGRIWKPEVLQNDAICVLVHPWSVLGGSSGNTEPYAQILAKTHGIECLTFDLRGVGQSTGSSTYRGTAEIEDVLSACNFVISRSPTRPIILIGSSAGASIAGSAFNRVPGAIAYIGIGYTFGWMSRLIFGHHFDAILKCMKPKLFIMGTKDEFTSVAQLQDKAATMTHVQIKIIPGVGHFELETSRYAKVTSEIIAKYIFELNEKKETLVT